MIAYRIVDGEIVDVIAVTDDASPPESYAIDDSVPAGTGVGCRLIGGVWTAPEVPPAEPVPLSPLTARQLRLGLLKIGIKPTDVAAAIASLPAEQRDAAAIEWDYASEYRRDHPLIAQLGATFGLTSEQIDDAWREAMAL